MIPANVKYQSKAEIAPARRYRTNIQPQNGTGSATSGYTGNTTIIINIPTRNNTALITSESCLKFSTRCTVGGTAATVFNLESCGAHSYIQRIRVFHGSNLLSDIDQYNGLAKILYDFQMPLDAVQGRYSATSGTTNEYGINPVGTTIADIQGNGLVAKPTNRGKCYIAPNATTASSVLAANATFDDNFSINLISLVGSLSGSKYLPLWEMTSAPLRVEIQLVPSIVNAFAIAPAGAVSAAGFTLYNVEYVAEFLELPDSAIAAIKAGSSNPLQMVFSDFRSYPYSTVLQNSTTQVSMPIPAKFSSLKSISVAQKITTGAATFYPLWSSNFNLQSYQFRIGSEVVPSQAPSTSSDFFNEAVKCFGSIADLGYQPSVDIDAYSPAVANWSTAAAGVIMDTFLEAQTANSGSFVVGIDLESYQNTDKSTIFAGMNTNTSDIFYNPTHNATASNTAINYNAYANFDSVLVCENGVAYVRF